MKPTVREVAPFVVALLRGHPAGCCLHVVLDEGNLSNSAVHHCLSIAYGNAHPVCVGLCLLLGQMSKTQRAKLLKVRR